MISLSHTSTVSFVFSVFRTVYYYRRRQMAGGFDHKMGVHKNKYIEEWTGRREITEQAFTVNSSNIISIVMSVVVFPVVVFFATKAELRQKGGRRYNYVFDN
jgi:hypothetical protein